MKYATIAIICLISLAAGTATAIASTTPSSHRSGTRRRLRCACSGTRSARPAHLALRTAYVAALPEPRHGHAERTATTIPELVSDSDPVAAPPDVLPGRAARRQPVLDGLRCIHQYEGPWNAVSDSSPTYYGGLQMDRSFEQAYGDDVLAAYGGTDANGWSAHDQLMVGHARLSQRRLHPVAEHRRGVRPALRAAPPGRRTQIAGGAVSGVCGVGGRAFGVSVRPD